MPSPSPEPRPALAGLNVLVVEDEMTLAILIEDLLCDLGCHVVKAGQLSRALTLATTAKLDGAILDINIDGEMVYPVARVLQARGIPFIFSSGYTAPMLPAEFQGVPILPKPFEDSALRPLTEQTFTAATRE